MKLDYLRLLLLIGSAGCCVTWLQLRRTLEAEDSGWRSRLTAEVVAGRSVSSALLAERGADSRAAFHGVCRGLPVEPPRGDESSDLLLRAALEARSASLKKTEEAVSKVKEVLESFDSNEARLRELASSAGFRGLVLSAVLCFLIPFFIEMLPLLGVLQGGSFALSPNHPLLRDMGVALALISSHYLSSIGSAGGRGQAWGRMGAFMAILFVSTSVAASLPLVGGA